MRRLKSLIGKIDKKGYKAYKDLKGEYNFGDFKLSILKVQSDPFASPSIVEISFSQHGYKDYYSEESRLPLEDFVYRKLYSILKKVSKQRGTGKSGLFFIPYPTQAYLRRSAVNFLLDGEILSLKFQMGFPAFGRRISGELAEEMFFSDLPLIKRDLKLKSFEKERLKEHIELFKEQMFLRSKINEKGLLAFIGDGSVLPRSSGVSDLPMKNAKKFFSPESLRICFKLPNRKELCGMGIREGITLITGGGFHGKTTLLSAIEQGIYNHIRGDGREYVITREDALKIVSEDGRSIRRVDISNFIRNLPQGYLTDDFSTDDASGSTSMAATISEAMEYGVKLFLIDEDKTATNFMIKDERMEELIEKEPIMPFVERIEEMKKLGISTIIVAGGAGEYLRVADTVLLMEEFSPYDATDKAKKIVEKVNIGNKKKNYPRIVSSKKRVFDLNSISPFFKGKLKIKSSKNSAFYGGEEIELSSLEQIKSEEQIHFALYVLSYIYRKKEKFKGEAFFDILKKVFVEFKDKGFKVFDRFSTSFFEIRQLDVWMITNRIRKLKVLGFKNSF